MSIVRTTWKMIVRAASMLIERTASMSIVRTAAAVCSSECCRAQRELSLRSELEKERSKPGGGSKVRAAYLERMLQMMKDDLGKKEQQMDGKVVDPDGCFVLQNLLLRRVGWIGIEHACCSNGEDSCSDQG